MTRDTQNALLLAGLGGLALWLWFSRSGQAVARSAGAAVASGATIVTETVQKLIRGERNNNPGNIRISASSWQGKVPVSENTDGAFEQFRDTSGVPGAVWGIRALGKTLLTYYRTYGLNTVNKIISRWAPSNENDTGAYARAVAAALNVGADTPITLTSPPVMFALVKAIIRHENGRVIYDDATINNGVSRALT